MRIGYLTYGLDRNPGGIGRYALELLHVLASYDNIHIVLLTTEREDIHGVWQQFEHHPLPGCRYLPMLMTLGHAEIALAAACYNLDLIFDPFTIAPFLGPRLGTRRIVTIHDTIAYHDKTHNRLDRWRYRYMLPRILPHVDKVITVSNHSCSDIQSCWQVERERIHIVPEATHARFRPVPDSAERHTVLAYYDIPTPYILYIGGLNPRKNITGLLEAYAQVCNDYPERLVIVGKKEWKTSNIAPTIMRLGLEDAVHFTGYVNDEDLPTLYSAASLFVFPSFYEGFGLPPLEAMACGTPVVTSGTSSLPEVVHFDSSPIDDPSVVLSNVAALSDNDAAIMVNPHDSNEIAQGIRLILDTPALAAELRARGLKRAAHCSWERAAEETMHVFHAAMEKPLETSLGKTMRTGSILLLVAWVLFLLFRRRNNRRTGQVTHVVEH